MKYRLKCIFFQFAHTILMSQYKPSRTKSTCCSTFINKRGYQNQVTVQTKVRFKALQNIFACPLPRTLSSRAKHKLYKIWHISSNQFYLNFPCFKKTLQIHDLQKNSFTQIRIVEIRFSFLQVLHGSLHDGKILHQ